VENHAARHPSAFREKETMATSARSTLTRPAALSARRALAAPALLAAPLFLLTAALLTWTNSDALRAWGWTAADHHGVPWPSSLAVLPHGWLQAAAFACAGAALIALAAAQPRRGRALGLAACGIGLTAAAFPLDPPVGDPTTLASWVRSWHAAVHAGGFVLAGLAAPVAIAATRRRTDVVLAVALTTAALLGGTPGWYAYVTGFLTWVDVIAIRLFLAPLAHATPAAFAPSTVPAREGVR
jgi:hypothetical protein